MASPNLRINKAGRCINIRQAQIFAGLSGGYCFGDNKTSNADMHYNGYNLGAQLSFTYRVIGHLGVKGTLQGSFTWQIGKPRD